MVAKATYTMVLLFAVICLVYVSSKPMHSSTLILLILQPPFIGVQGQLTTVTSLPEVLFNGGSQDIVEGSVVWLYCEVDTVYSTVTATWNKDSEPLVQDVPHIHMETSSSDSSTTFLLMVDDFQTSDSGVYQCTTQEGAVTAMGTALNLTGNYYCRYV